MKIITVAPALVRRGNKVFQRNSFSKLPPIKNTVALPRIKTKFR